MVPMDDAKFMVYVTSLTQQNTESTNNTLFKLFGGIEKVLELATEIAASLYPPTAPMQTNMC